MQYANLEQLSSISTVVQNLCLTFQHYRTSPHIKTIIGNQIRIIAPGTTLHARPTFDIRNPYHKREVVIDLLNLKYYTVYTVSKRGVKTRNESGVCIDRALISKYFKPSGNLYVFNTPLTPIPVAKGILLTFPTDICLKLKDKQTGMYSVEDTSRFDPARFDPARTEDKERHHILDVWDNRECLSEQMQKSDHNDRHSHCTILEIKNEIDLHHFGIYLEYTSSNKHTFTQYNLPLNEWH